MASSKRVNEMKISGKNTIGTVLSQFGTKSFKTFNPVLNQENETVFFEATSDEVQLAMSQAQESFPAFAQTSGKSRATFLRKIAALLDENREILLACYAMESGLSLERGDSELNRTIFHCHAFAEFIEDDSWRYVHTDTAKPERTPAPKPEIRKLNFPLGPVVVFGASNFPFAYSTIGGDSVAALAAGCPVIVKSHPMHAGTGDLVSQLIVRAILETGMPEGIFSNLNASGFEVGEQLVLHPFTKAVGFTGSYEGGMALHKLAQQRKEPIPVFAEMGSLNPVFLLPEALSQNRDIAIKLAESITQSSGQFCTKPGLIFAMEGDAFDAFKKQFTEEINRREPQSMLHPNIWRKYNALRNEVASQDSVSVLSEVQDPQKPNFGLPQISMVKAEIFNHHKILQQEVFGPHSLLVACKDISDMLITLKNLEGQLTCSIFASDEELVTNQELLFHLQTKAGRIIFNGVPTGVEVSPAMHHGGPFPSTTDSRYTAVGIQSIQRFTRAVSIQNIPQVLLPKFLK